MTKKQEDITVIRSNSMPVGITYRIFAERRPWSDAIYLDIAVRYGLGNEKKSGIVSGLELTHFEDEAIATPIETTPIRLTTAEAQELANALWGAGIRPTDVVANQGEMERAKAHILDMQKTVEKLYEIIKRLLDR